MPLKSLYLHNKFYYGNTDTDWFKDYVFIKGEDLTAFVSFLFSCLNGKKLQGRNKPSWLDDKGQNIRACPKYRKCKIWHYHSGPHAKSAKYYTNNIRVQNLGENTSNAVIHYSWLSPDSVVILAYSPKHNPFPKEDSRSNKIRSRFPKIEETYDVADLLDARVLLSISTKDE
ncbi:hypothetical protein FNO25_001318 [Vibrio fluvialis]|uniref:hypothetical protein n=1 Tax=Vibrio fluvialis TaxID=676 RepID=UPI0014052B62|nr:hypothetical protein [Vibrio fluvialis]EKO3973347.1 hypothetical protein [Vibrio fluvialis]NHN74010.1 hypothetical protein [Vibrio fluvialis]